MTKGTGAPSVNGQTANEGARVERQVRIEHSEPMSPGAATDRISEMLAQAQDFVRLSTQLSKGYLDQGRLRDALTATASRVRHLEVLVYSPTDEGAGSGFEWLLDLPNTFVAESEERVPDFLAVDGRSFRVEEDTPTSMVEVKNLTITDCPPDTARILELGFERMWERAKVQHRPGNPPPFESTLPSGASLSRPVRHIPFQLILWAEAGLLEDSDVEGYRPHLESCPYCRNRLPAKFQAPPL